MHLTVNTREGSIGFDSPYSDDEVVGVLRGLIARRQVMSSFAEDLLQNAESYTPLSRSQLNWVHKLVVDAERRSRDRAPTEITGQTRKPGSHRWTHPST
jgi:hypothetical protein